VELLLNYRLSERGRNTFHCGCVGKRSEGTKTKSRSAVYVSSSIDHAYRVFRYNARNAQKHIEETSMEFI